MVTTNIKDTRGNDGIMFVGSIESERFSEGRKTSRLKLKMVYNRRNGIVKLFFFNGIGETKPFIVSTFRHQELWVEDEIYTFVKSLVEKSSFGRFSDDWIESFSNSGLR